MQDVRSGFIASDFWVSSQLFFVCMLEMEAQHVASSLHAFAAVPPPLPAAWEAPDLPPVAPADSESSAELPPHASPKKTVGMRKRRRMARGIARPRRLEKADFPRDRGRWSAVRPFVVLSLAATSCASATVAPSDSSVSAPAAASVVEAPTAPPASSSAEPTSPPTPDAITSAAPPPAVTPPPPAPTDASVIVEQPHRTGSFPWPEGAKERKAKLKELETWNQGGLADGEAWHAAPRVVIGEPVVTKGKADAHDVMRVLRAEQYWTVRRCYDPMLRDSPKLDGRAVIEIVVDKSGRVTTATAKKSKVPDTRKHKTAMSNKEVVRCWVRGMTGIELPRPRSKSATMAFSIDVWPGDAPMPEVGATPKPGRIDLAVVKKRVDERVPDLTACLAAGWKEKPGAWGRLALRVDVGEDGAVSEVAETESTFPVPSVVACATRILRGLEWPKAQGGPARVTIPLRFAPMR